MCQVSRPATFRNYMGCHERQERWLLELLATASAVASGSENHKTAKTRRTARSASQSASARVAAPTLRPVANVSSRTNQSTPRVDVVAVRHARARRARAVVARRGRRRRRTRALSREPRLRLRVATVASRSPGGGGVREIAADAAEEHCAGGTWSARAREGRRPEVSPACGSSALTGSCSGAGPRVSLRREPFFRSARPRGSTSAVARGPARPSGPWRQPARKSRPRSRCRGPGRTLEKFRARRACDKRQECSPVCIPPCFPR